jgi:hypothetical protein
MTVAFCAKGLVKKDVPSICSSAVDVVKFSPVRKSKTSKTDDENKAANKNKAVGKKIVIGCASTLLKDKSLEELFLR